MRRHGLFFLAGLLLLLACARDAFDDWVVRTKLPVLALETSVEVRDRNGELLRAYTVEDGLWRLPVSLDQVDPAYLAMLLSYEDHRFRSHNGVDLLAMLRALGQAVWNGQVISGGSTLTMQVARMLENSGTGAWEGKLRQIRLALALERHLSKDEILTLYLTEAPYGGNIEGIRAATLSYFGKEPTRLTPAEAALLVALPQSPETRRPDRHHANAVAARLRVFTRMVDQGRLSAESLRGALSEPVPVIRSDFPALAPHLADRAVAQNRLRQRHRLTIDASLQRRMEALARRSLRGGPERLSIGIVIADHRSGEILASVGSAGYEGGNLRQGYVDMTRALRSPGSTLKPLVYAMAFDLGLAHPKTLIDDRPIAFGSYAPQNFDGRFRGELRVADALRLSLNIPVVMLTQEIGPSRLMGAMRGAGMEVELSGGKAGLAIALGGLGASLEDMVQLYAGLAHGGKSVPLYWDAEQPPLPSRQIVSRSAAWQVGHILSDIPPPPGASFSGLAYKTGTSYGHRDAWAIGFDGAHVIGVWIGRPDGTSVPGAFGGELAAPVLFEAFQRVKPRLDALPPPPPETLLLSVANLPQPLQRFQRRKAVFSADADAPQLAYPPDGAVVALEGQMLVAKVRNGKPPFTWLANGLPIRTSGHDRQVNMPGVGRGYVNISVIDATGRAARAQVNLR